MGKRPTVVSALGFVAVDRSGKSGIVAGATATLRPRPSSARPCSFTASSSVSSTVVGGCTNVGNSYVGGHRDAWGPRSARQNTVSHRRCVGSAVPRDKWGKRTNVFDDLRVDVVPVPALAQRCGMIDGFDRRGITSEEKQRDRTAKEKTVERESNTRPADTFLEYARQQRSESFVDFHGDVATSVALASAPSTGSISATFVPTAVSPTDSIAPFGSTQTISDLALMEDAKGSGRSEELENIEVFSDHEHELEPAVVLPGGCVDRDSNRSIRASSIDSVVESPVSSFASTSGGATPVGLPAVLCVFGNGKSTAADTQRQAPPRGSGRRMWNGGHPKKRGARRSSERVAPSAVGHNQSAAVPMMVLGPSTRSSFTEEVKKSRWYIDCKVAEEEARLAREKARQLQAFVRKQMELDSDSDADAAVDGNVDREASGNDSSCESISQQYPFVAISRGRAPPPSPCSSIVFLPSAIDV
eukprot:TRINITY_DN29859_c0_g1_i1.p1 TRINITY_DN29859_c0_g1~~TRINITY_DN29859_c0_g1_i1.p1  ORF type:complete len:472 (-),score=61.09 TRINITY_DN29859_c0_g1_i1:580-1995(-)